MDHAFSCLLGCSCYCWPYNDPHLLFYLNKTSSFTHHKHYLPSEVFPSILPILLKAVTTFFLNTHIYLFIYLFIYNSTYSIFITLVDKFITLISWGHGLHLIAFEIHVLKIVQLSWPYDKVCAGLPGFIINCTPFHSQKCHIWQIIYNLHSICLVKFWIHSICLV